MRKRHALLDPAEFERRVQENKSLWLEGAMVAVTDVILTAATVKVLPWFILLPTVAVVSVVAFFAARRVERFWARRHTVPLEMYAEALARHTDEPRPRIRVEIVEKLSPEDKSEQGMMPHLWGLRILNDGAPAVFEALMEVKDGAVGVPRGRNHIAFSHSGEPRVRIATGAEDKLFFGRIDWSTFYKTVGSKALYYFDDRQRRNVDGWLQGTGMWLTATPETTADVEITITSEPQLPNGPWRSLYRLGPEKLIELTPSAPHIVVHPSPESA